MRSIVAVLLLLPLAVLLAWRAAPDRVAGRSSPAPSPGRWARGIPPGPGGADPGAVRLAPLAVVRLRLLDARALRPLDEHLQPPLRLPARLRPFPRGSAAGRSPISSWPSGCSSGCPGWRCTTTSATSGRWRAGSPPSRSTGWRDGALPLDVAPWIAAALLLWTLAHVAVFSLFFSIPPRGSTWGRWRSVPSCSRPPAAWGSRGRTAGRDCWRGPPWPGWRCWRRRDSPSCGASPCRTWGTGADAGAVQPLAAVEGGAAGTAGPALRPGAGPGAGAADPGGRLPGARLGDCRTRCTSGGCGRTAPCPGKAARPPCVRIAEEVG